MLARGAFWGSGKVLLTLNASSVGSLFKCFFLSCQCAALRTAAGRWTPANDSVCLPLMFRDSILPMVGDFDGSNPTIVAKFACVRAVFRQFCLLLLSVQCELPFREHSVIYCSGSGVPSEILPVPPSRDVSATTNPNPSRKHGTARHTKGIRVGKPGVDGPASGPWPADGARSYDTCGSPPLPWSPRAQVSPNEYGQVKYDTDPRTLSLLIAHHRLPSGLTGRTMAAPVDV